MIYFQEADYERRTNELSSHLCRRGYKSENVDHAITKASSIHKHELLKYKPKVTQSRIPFVVTYHPDLPKIQNIINKHWQIINTNTELNRIFPGKPTVTLRRPQKPQRHPSPDKGHIQTGKPQRGVKAMQKATLPDNQTDAHSTNIQRTVWGHLRHERT